MHHAGFTDPAGPQAGIRVGTPEYRQMRRALFLGGFIPGVKPGKATAGHIDELLSRITLPGAVFLGIVAILPAFAILLGIKQGFAQFFGGTSLLIMVGVLLDTLQQIESHLLMRHYDGLMKTGRIKGRQSATYSMATG